MNTDCPACEPEVIHPDVDCPLGLPAWAEQRDINAALWREIQRLQEKVATLMADQVQQAFEEVCGD